MAKTVMVLAVPHPLQGEKFPGFVADASYGLLVEHSIVTRGVNFVFEEASGLGPTVAEVLAKGYLGPGLPLHRLRPRTACVKNRAHRLPTRVIEAAIGEKDWGECPSCGAGGWNGDKCCEQCNGAGWIFIRGERQWS